MKILRYTVNDFISKQHISEITHSTSELYGVVCLILMLSVYSYQGWIQDFKLGGALKIIAPSGGRRGNCWGIRVKNHDFTPKNHFFSNFRGGARAGCAPSGSAPGYSNLISTIVPLMRFFNDRGRGDTNIDTGKYS